MFCTLFCPVLHMFCSQSFLYKNSNLHKYLCGVTQYTFLVGTSSFVRKNTLKYFEHFCPKKRTSFRKYFEEKSGFLNNNSGRKASYKYLSK